MYWEDVWKRVEIAANADVMEKNEEFRFHFMLHADKKAAQKWKDAKLPYPVKIESSGDGVDQLPEHLKKFVIKE